MRKLILVLLTFSTLLAANPDGKGTVKGRVLNSSTQEPIFGANILVVGTNLGSSTDLDGRFEIVGVPSGTYVLRITAIGYTPLLRSDIVVSASRPTELKIDIVESLVEVEGVSVTATYFQKLPDKPVSSLTQSNEEIRRLPGGLEDVVRAISILPGVAQVQAGRNDLIVRGGAPSENLFIIDNIEVPNINHFGTQGASGGPLSYINLDFVRNTRFATGGFGPRFGDKLSSVLTIDLREGRDDRFGGKATISASQFGLNLEGPVGERGSLLFSARRSYLDFIFKAAGFGFVPEYWDFLGKLDYRLGQNDELSILGISVLDNVRFFNDTEEQRFDNSRVLGSDQQQVVGGATWKHIFGAGYTSVTLSRVDVTFDYLQTDSLLNPIFGSSSREVENTVRGDLVLLFGHGSELSAGVQSKFIDFNSSFTIPLFQSSFGDSIAVTRTFGTGAWKSAAYAQFSQAFGPLRLTGGVRGDYFDRIDEPFTLAPRFSFTYALLPTMNLSGSVGRYYQSPSYVWLSGNPSNRSLRPIGVTQYILGTDYLLRPDTRISIEVYRKDYIDYPASLTRSYLVMANTGAGFGGSEEGFASFGFDPLASIGTGRAQGVELLVQKRLSEVPCYGTVSISYNTTKFVALDGVSRPGSFDQRWILNVGGGYIFDEHWEVSTKFRLATGRPYTPFGPGGVQTSTFYNTARVGTNHSLDVRVDRRWQFDSWTLITYVDIQNIYNRQPLDVPRFNPRTQRAEVNESIGLLPTIGISAEF